jgi:hypothetical protein
MTVRTILAGALAASAVASGVGAGTAAATPSLKGCGTFTAAGTTWFVALHEGISCSKATAVVAKAGVAHTTGPKTAIRQRIPANGQGQQERHDMRHSRPSRSDPRGGNGRTDAQMS